MEQEPDNNNRFTEDAARWLVQIIRELAGKLFAFQDRISAENAISKFGAEDIERIRQYPLQQTYAITEALADDSALGIDVYDAFKTESDTIKTVAGRLNQLIDTPVAYEESKQPRKDRRGGWYLEADVSYCFEDLDYEVNFEILTSISGEPRGGEIAFHGEEEAFRKFMLIPVEAGRFDDLTGFLAEVQAMPLLGYPQDRLATMPLLNGQLGFQRIGFDDGSPDTIIREIEVDSDDAVQEKFNITELYRRVGNPILVNGKPYNMFIEWIDDDDDNEDDEPELFPVDPDTFARVMA